MTRPGIPYERLPLKWGASHPEVPPLAKSASTLPIMPSDGRPPAYSHGSHHESASSPSYSAVPDDSELTLHHSPASPTAADTETILSSAQSATEYVYRNKHIELNLGPRLWGTKSPAYGRGGVVEAQLTLVGELARVASVQVKLEGRVTTTMTERGHVSGASDESVLLNVVSLNPDASGEWVRQHAISLPFPAYVRGGMSPLPPTCTSYHPGATCEVKYYLKVTLVRKGFRRNDHLKIVLLYLPRSFARGPSLHSIPNVIANSAAPTPVIEDADQVAVIQLTASWRNDQKRRASTSVLPPSVFLAIPSVLSFASCDAIPLTLNIVSQNAPALTKLLAPTIRIQLVKRTKFWINSGRQYTQNDYALCAADILGINNSKEGVCVMNCELSMNRVASQQSWTVENVAFQQHLVKVIVQPPASVADHVPRFECEVAVELTTDTWDSPEREAEVVGRAPRPAIRFESSDLDRAGSSSSAVPCARSTYMGIR